MKFILREYQAEQVSLLILSNYGLCQAHTSFPLLATTLDKCLFVLLLLAGTKHHELLERLILDLQRPRYHRFSLSQLEIPMILQPEALHEVKLIIGVPTRQTIFAFEATFAPAVTAGISHGHLLNEQKDLLEGVLRLWKYQECVMCFDILSRMPQCFNEEVKIQDLHLFLLLLLGLKRMTLGAKGCHHGLIKLLSDDKRVDVRSS